MSNDSSSADPGRRVSLAQTLLLGVAGLSLYVLSVGPVNWFFIHGKLAWAHDAVWAAYAPLRFIYNSIPAVQPSFDAYLSWWR